MNDRLTPGTLSRICFTTEPLHFLETLHFIGDSGWDCNGQAEEMMQGLLEHAASEDLSLART